MLISNQYSNGWLLMSFIPCTSKCVYQSDGLCVLDSATAAGVPSFGGACIHFIPADEARLGLPHRYCEPESMSTPKVASDYQHGASESGTV